VPVVCPAAAHHVKTMYTAVMYSWFRLDRDMPALLQNIQTMQTRLLI